MEAKIKVTAVVVKKQTDTYTIREVTTEDEKKYDTFDDLKEGQEYSGEIVPNKNPQYNSNFKLAKPAGAAGKFPMKDYSFLKRECALKCAIDGIKLTDKQVTSANIIALANEFHAYLNSK